eukprot:1139945-Alexandrium_andersonii.AAC.1
MLGTSHTTHFLRNLTLIHPARDWKIPTRSPQSQPLRLFSFLLLLTPAAALIIGAGRLDVGHQLRGQVRRGHCERVPRVAAHLGDVLRQM